MMFLLMGFGTNEILRRWNYDLFLYLHHFSLVVFLMMLWHATMAWYYITAGLFLWLVDHCIRLSRSIGYNIRVKELKVVVDNSNSRIIRFSYHVSRPKIFQSIYNLFLPFHRDDFAPLPHKMGQYVFINIPAISGLAWHPFR
jgi:predicted ferric reductase